MSAVNKTIESVQVLRAVAAIGVVLFHASTLLEIQDASKSSWSGLGAAGVDLFFVVSGFIMWVTAVERGESVRRFAIKRILRIVPLYWLMTGIVLLISVAKPNLMRNASHNVTHYVASLVFLAWPHPTLQGRYWPPVVPGWTLNYEMAFYLIVAVSLCLPKMWRGYFIGGVLAGLALVGATFHPSQELGFYTNPIILEFILGVAIAISVKSNRVCMQLRRPGVPYALAIAGAALFIAVGRLNNDDNRLLVWGIPLAIVVLGSVNIAVSMKYVVLRWLARIGDASYSIYLTQFLVLSPVALIMAHALGQHPGKIADLAFVATLTACAVAFGLVSYALFEQPVQRASRGLIAGAPPAKERVAAADW
jgi:exopolysaccharide production protein ExoZ